MISDVELRHLRYVIAVADDLSFTRAAERLHIAQPALSQQIRQLEERVGTTLIVRRPRVSLTPAGDAFVTAARRAVAHVQQAGETARRIAAGTRAVVHVGLASSAALTAIPAIVKRFMALHADVEVALHELHSAEQLESLRQGSLDVAVLREAVVDPLLESHELLRESFVLLTPAGGSSRRRTSDLSHYANEPFILFARRTAPTLYEQIVSLCREAGFEPRVVHEMNEWHTIAGLVGAGLGVSIGPESVRSLGIRGVRSVPLRRGGRRAVLFLCHAANGASEAALRFSRFARGQIDAPRMRVRVNRQP
jgi:DNA-binding transcriptional LysR family regulator